MIIRYLEFFGVSTFIGTLRGVGGRGVGDYTSLNRPY